MLRIFIFSFLILFSTTANTQSTLSLVKVPAKVFVNKGLTTFDSILFVNNKTKTEVQRLFEQRELSHELASENDVFEKYWEVFGNQWYWVKLKPDMPPFLIFKGMNSFSDEKEYIELYDVRQKEQNRIFISAGNLLAYKKHSLTGELILFVHKYPCCKSASHKIINVRYLNDEVRSNHRFFVGRDTGDMIGPFFPETVNNPKEYKYLSAKTTLRWSPAVVLKDAFLGRAESNVIINYQEGSVYKVLQENKNWQFVIMFSGITKEQSSVMNYTNFINIPVYGWIKK